jgi:hypothetical protein
VHEFGHAFAGLADEYYTSDVAYRTPTRRASSLGAQHHGAARSGATQVARPRRAGHADPDAVGPARFDAAMVGFNKQRRELLARKASDGERRRR